MSRRSTLIGLTAATAAVLTLAGCSSPDPAPPAPPPTTEPTTLRTTTTTTGPNWQNPTEFAPPPGGEFAPG